jgi:hypothetical protein
MGYAIRGYGVIIRMSQLLLWSTIECHLPAAGRLQETPGVPLGARLVSHCAVLWCGCTCCLPASVLVSWQLHAGLCFQCVKVVVALGYCCATAVVAQQGALLAAIHD